MSRILYACSAEPGYIRNRVLVRALRRTHDVRVVASASRRYPVRLASVVPRTAIAGSADIYLAGFLGQPLVPFMWARGRQPIVLDAFISIYDTLCFDRQQFSPGSPVGRFSRWLDSWSARRARLVLTDTPASARYLIREFGTLESKIVSVPVGADESLFYPRRRKSAGDTITVLYVTTYLPLHGITTVIEAIRALKGAAKLRFVIVGGGMERERAEAAAREYHLDSLEFVNIVPLDELPDHLAACDIFLGGHFNATNDKARRVIAGKIYQGLAMAKPTIVGESEATQEWFSHGESAYSVPMGDGEALATAIQELADDASLRQRIGDGGRALFEERFSESAIATTLDESLGSLA